MPAGTLVGIYLWVNISKLPPESVFEFKKRKRTTLKSIYKATKCD